MIDRKEQWDKIKYDSFLNSVEETFREYYSDDKNLNQQMLSFSQQIIEKFVDTYGDREEPPLSLETRRMVLECIMHNN